MLVEENYAKPCLCCTAIQRFVTALQCTALPHSKLHGFTGECISGGHSSDVCVASWLMKVSRENGINSQTKKLRCTYKGHGWVCTLTGVAANICFSYASSSTLHPCQSFSQSVGRSFGLVQLLGLQACFLNQCLLHRVQKGENYT